MVEKAFSFELKNDPSELNRLCQHCEKVGHTIGLSKKAIFEINLALDELFTNIISYGFKDKEEHKIHIQIAVDEKELTLRVEDSGVPFNPLEAQAPNFNCTIEECQIGGLGIHLIKKVMDKVLYKRKADKNVLLLKKKISGLDEKLLEKLELE